MMKQLGMSQEEIEATRVIIEKTDNTQLIINNPSVTKMNIQGNEMFQISGDVSEETGAQEISEDDIKTVAEKTGATHDQAKEVLESVNGDLAEAILELSS